MRITIRLDKTHTSVYLLAAICVMNLSPALDRLFGKPFGVLLMGLFLLLNSNRMFFCDNHEKNTRILIFLYIGILFIYKLGGLSTTSVSYHLGIAEFFLLYICMGCMYRQITYRQSVFILAAALLTMAVTMLQNYQLKAVWGYRYSIWLYERYGVKTVINTQYTGAILLTSGILFCGFLHSSGLFHKLFFALAAAACIYFNFAVTQRGIILLLTLFMIPMLILFNEKRNSAKLYMGIFATVFLLLFLMSQYEIVLTWIANISGSERLASRLNSIIRVIQTGGIEGSADGSLETRIRLTITSIRTFTGSIGNFIMGAGHRMDSTSLVGNHCQVADEFARFGIIGGTLSLVIIVRMLRNTITMSLTEKGTALHAQLTVIMLIAFLRMFMGTIIDPSIGAAVFIIIPLTARIIQEDRGKAV